MPVTEYTSNRLGETGDDGVRAIMPRMQIVFLLANSSRVRSGSPVQRGGAPDIPPAPRATSHDT